MSIAEFYIDNGLDLLDPNHMDDYLACMRHESGFESDESEPNYYENTTHFSGLAIVQSSYNSDYGNVLNRYELDAMARSYGYQILDTSSS